MEKGKRFMPHIELLDQITIDKIAAGEVIERPASVIKELVENAIDAGAGAVVVEIEDGGITLMRITDNGCGIERCDVENAFLRHSTSKIHSAEDLSHISSLGFRGEALSSIAAVARVELITKAREEVFGTRYLIEGGKGKTPEDTGAPDGTTFLVRQLFYNTPARRKFLKTPMTEAAHISDLLTRLALSHPEISFQFISNRQTRLHTSGNGKLKDVIYHIYGRDVANHLLPMEFEKNGVTISGFLGKPLISRGNRNYENYFVNGRYVRSSIISKAVEDAYKDFSMQHRYPFVAFRIQIDQEEIDVNVHPSKMELRFSNQQEIYNLVYEAVREGLREKELIPEVELPEPAKAEQPAAKIPERTAGKETADETIKTAGMIRENGPVYGTDPDLQEREDKDLDYFMKKMRERVYAHYGQEEKNTECTPEKEEHAPFLKNENSNKTEHALENCAHYPHNNPQNKQLNLFEEQLLTREVRQEYQIIGQVFDTYWLVQFQDSLYIIDQHAAHERVLYERTLAGMRSREYTSQYLSPPIILSLSMQEADILERYKDRFTAIGFEIEPFGGDEYAVRAIPDNLFGIAKKELLLEMLDSLSDGLATSLEPETIDEKIASMSCKAAVKGNSRLSHAEVDTLIGELLTLENPYHCPHGRPTIIAMTKRELEKKFKRIV